MSSVDPLDIAIITARGGSVGVPGKNIRPLAGRPLIAWTIEAALASQCFRRVVVSTDDPAIAEASRAAGAEVPFMRPAELATSSIGSLEVMDHALDALDIHGSFGLLQPTSPFRTARHVAEAAALFRETGAPSVVSMVQGKPLSWAYVMKDDKLTRAVDADNATRRQAGAEILYPNGAIYLKDVAHFRAERAFLTPQTRPYMMDTLGSLDIDTEADFRIAEAVAGMTPQVD